MENFDFSIINEAHSEISRLITEEYGVNRLVSEGQKTISDIVRKQLENEQLKQNKDGVYYKEYNFPTNVFFGVKLNMFFIIYYFENIEDYYNNSDKYAYNEKTKYNSVDNTYNIIIKSISINGNLKKDSFEDTIQHELEHVFQMYMSNKNALFKNKDLYEKIVFYINNDDSIDDFSKKVAYALYICFKPEQDAIINGLDASLEYGYIDKVKHDLYKSYAYEMLLNLKETIKEIEEIDDEFDIKSMNIKVYFNMGKDKVLHLLKQAESAFVRKIGRIVYKHSEF